MDAVLGRFSAQAYAIFRIMAGAMFFIHGTQKILGWPPPDKPGPLPPIAMAAGIIELVCGFAILIGLFAGFAAFISSGEMAVAYFMAHFKPTGLKWIPNVNRGENAVLYCFAFLLIAAYGAGIWSVDHARGATSSTAAARS